MALFVNVVLTALVGAVLFHGGNWEKSGRLWAFIWLTFIALVAWGLYIVASAT